ncbi:hypothetical protein WL547_12655, partial [Staphylococcus warneri]
IDEQQKPKVTQIENEFKQFASDKLKHIESRMDEIEEELTRDDIAEPQSELIRRQNLEARLSFYSNSEIMDYIREADAEKTDVFELSLLQKAFDQRLSESEQSQVSFSLTALKQSVLYPFENNEEHDNLAYQFNVLRQIGMANNGSV